MRDSALDGGPEAGRLARSAALCVPPATFRSSRGGARRLARSSALCPWRPYGALGGKHRIGERLEDGEGLVVYGVQAA